MGNTFGHLFRLTTFGESHGPAIGGVIDGCPAGLRLDLEAVQKETDRRRPGHPARPEEPSGSARQESDRIEWLSGLFEGVTTGAPLAFIIRNEDARSEDYDTLRELYRPSHADYTWQARYGIRDHRGGGRASGRETAVRVAAGAIARQVLPSDICIEAFTTGIGPLQLPSGCQLDSQSASGNAYHCPDKEIALEMEHLLRQTRQEGDSLGCRVSVCVKNVPAGWGEPIFDKLEARLAAAMLSIPACKGFSYGSGFDISLKGSQANDPFCCRDGRVRTLTNHSGGIQGGISNGEDIRFDLAFKPVASIAKPQTTVNNKGESVGLQITGRHDICLSPRVLPVVEAMTALCLADAFLLSKSSR